MHQSSYTAPRAGSRLAVSLTAVPSGTALTCSARQAGPRAPELGPGVGVLLAAATEQEDSR